MASSCWVPDLNKKEYKNWLTVGRAILTTQKGVASLIQLHIERLHQSLLLIPRLMNCGPCICTGMTSKNCVPCICIRNRKRRRACDSRVCLNAPTRCPFCDAWKAELESLEVRGTKAVIYDNAWKNCVWEDFNKQPWEVAKLFMAPLGSRKSAVKDAASTDLGSLMNLLERCPFIVPPVLRSAVCNVRDKVRNLWAHAANLEISDVDMNNAERLLRVLLADPVFANDADSQVADQEIQQLFKDGLICLPDAEFEVMKHLKVVLNQELEKLREDDKFQNEKIKNLEEMTNRITSGLEKRMKEVEIKTFELQETSRNLSESLVEAKEDLTGQSERLSKVEINVVVNEKAFRKVEAKQMEQDETFRMQISRNLPDFNLTKSQNDLKKLYLESMTHVQMTPWDPCDTCHIDKAYTKLSWVKKTKNVNETIEESLQHYRDIFQRNQHRLTIVEGQAGVGKSTFTKRLAVDWAEGREEVLRNFDLLLTIKLREVSSMPSFIDVLKICIGVDKEAEAEQLHKYITENQEKCLIVFDGFDEYEFSSENDIGQIIKGQKLRGCRVLVTSRPSVKFINQLRLYSHQHCKITGFDERDVEEYAKKHFSSQNEVQAFVHYLEESSLFSLAKIPLLCLFLCLLWKEKHSEDFPKTKTELYKEIVQCILDHSTSKSDCPTRKSVDDYDTAMTKLGCIAYDALKRDSLIFDTDELRDVQEIEDIKRLGLLSTASARSRKPTQSVEFLHKSLQEFAAAWYVAKSLEKNPEKHQLLEDLCLERTKYPWQDNCSLKCHFLQSEDMIRFICGLSNEAAIVVFKKLCNLKENLRAKDVLSDFDYFDDIINTNFFLLFNEIMNSSFISKLFFGLCNDTLVVEEDDLPSDAKIVNLFKLGLKKLRIIIVSNIIPVISLCEKLDVKLPAVGNSISSEAVTFIQRLFNAMKSIAFYSKFSVGIVKDKNFILDMYEIDIDEFNTLSADILDLVCVYPTGLRKLVGKFPEGDIDLPCDELSNLKELRIWRCPRKLLDVLHFLLQLRKLKLVSCTEDIPCDSIQYLTLLEELDLCDTNLGFVWKHLSKLQHLKILKLQDWRSRASSGITELSTALDGIPELVELTLDYNQLGDEGVTSLAKHLCKVPQLQRLSLNQNCITANGVEKLSTALPDFSQLKHLNLSFNPLGDGVVALASHLSSVPQLEELELCHVDMTGAGVIALTEAFRHMHLLTNLNLSCNEKVDNGSWGKFADHLHYLEQLKDLVLDKCGIANNIQEKIKSVNSDTDVFFEFGGERDNKSRCNLM